MYDLKYAQPLTKKLFDIYVLFTREPFVNIFSQELEFYQSLGGRLIAFISLDKIDNNYSACVLSRDTAKQFRAERIQVDFDSIQDARIWLDQNMAEDAITHHENSHEFFDIFVEMKRKSQPHPTYTNLKEHFAFQAAKKVLQEISYHYKDIDGNFIEQFQSLNGFDARIWELYLFCLFREQLFSFDRMKEAPDFIVEKFSVKIAIEAVIVSRKTPIKEKLDYRTQAEINKQLLNYTPLLFSGALFDKTKKEYWKKNHVKGLPFVIAIADFHDSFSMTWSYPALLEYLYGHTYSYQFDGHGNVVTQSQKINSYIKANGKAIESGFFLNKENENISAVLFSSCATLSKFNRMGVQAGLGNKKSKLVRDVLYHDHDPNAVVPKKLVYAVSEVSNETWSEGAILFHNPYAKIPLNPNLFEDTVAHWFFDEKKAFGIFPAFFPYQNITKNLIIKES